MDKSVDHDFQHFHSLLINLWTTCSIKQNLLNTKLVVAYLNGTFYLGYRY